MNSKHIFLTLVLILPTTSIHAGTCLNGYELTAMVVLESDIRQAVSAYACESAGYNNGIYAQYKNLRSRWDKNREKEIELRNQVYQRIYGDDWQKHVDVWTQRIANEQMKHPTSQQYCTQLQQTIAIHSKDWETLYNSAARNAAGVAYDPLRCEKITIN